MRASTPHLPVQALRHDELLLYLIHLALHEIRLNGVDDALLHLGRRDVQRLRDLLVAHLLARAAQLGQSKNTAVLADHLFIQF